MSYDFLFHHRFHRLSQIIFIIFLLYTVIFVILRSLLLVILTTPLLVILRSIATKDLEYIHFCIHLCILEILRFAQNDRVKRIRGRTILLLVIQRSIALSDIQ